MQILWNLEEELFSVGIIAADNVVLPSLEKMLLDMIAYNCTEGLFYALTVQHEGRIISRFIESGRYYGAMKAFYCNRVSRMCGVTASEIYALNIYSNSDIIARSESLNLRRESIARSHVRGEGDTHSFIFELCLLNYVGPVSLD